MLLKFTPLVNDGSPRKISRIKALRTLTGCGLKEGKDLVEAAWPDGETTPAIVEVSDARLAVAFVAYAENMRHNSFYTGVESFREFAVEVVEPQRTFKLGD